MVTDKDGKPRGRVVVHCFCVHSGRALLGDLGVSRSMECECVLSYVKNFLECVLLYRMSFSSDILLCYIL